MLIFCEKKSGRVLDVSHEYKSNDQTERIIAIGTVALALIATIFNFIITFTTKGL